MFYKLLGKLPPGRLPPGRLPPILTLTQALNLTQGGICWWATLWGASFRSPFYKISVLKTFTKFTGKHLCRSLFLEVCNFIKTKTLAQMLFCAFAKFLRTSTLYNICERLLLKKEHRQNFVKNLDFLYRRAVFLVTLNICSKKIMRSC